MIWISILGLVLELILKLPAIIEVLKRIFGRLQSGAAVQPLRAMREGAKLHAAIAAKLAQVQFAEKHGLQSASLAELACPLEAYEADLTSRYKQEEGA